MAKHLPSVTWLLRPLGVRPNGYVCTLDRSNMCTLHWSEKQEIRRAAGLEPLAKYTPLARFDHDTGQWVPIPEADDREPQPSDGPDYHADHASWEQRRAERQRRAHVPAEASQ